MPAAREKMQVDRNIIRKAIYLVLADLKEKHAGILLSARAHKVNHLCLCLIDSHSHCHSPTQDITTITEIM